MHFTAIERLHAVKDFFFKILINNYYFNIKHLYCCKRFFFYV